MLANLQGVRRLKFRNSYDEITYKLPNGKINRVVFNHRRHSAIFYDHNNRIILIRKGLTPPDVYRIQAQIKQWTKVIIHAKG